MRARLGGTEWMKKTGRMYVGERQFRKHMVPVCLNGSNSTSLSESTQWKDGVGKAAWRDGETWKCGLDGD